MTKVDIKLNGAIETFFCKEFQLMIFALDNSSLSSN